MRFEVNISESEDEARPYTAEDKFKAMAERNPVLKKMKEKLDLELEL